MINQELKIDEFPDLAEGIEQLDKQILRFSISINLPKDGYGACKSCSCKGWKPNNPKNDYCRECGHHWTQHRDSYKLNYPGNEN